MKKYFSFTNAILVLGILISFILGFVTLQNQVTFGYDQSRDAFGAVSILKGDLKIIGPMTDIPGVFHGVFYYYFLALLYALSHGDPQLVATFYFFFIYLTLPACGYLVYLLFKRKDVVVVSLLLYAFSPLFIAFSKWLSNPGPTIMLMPFLLIYLWKYIQVPKKLYAGIIGALFGLMIQFNLAFGLLLVLLPIYKLVFRFKTRFSDIGIFLVALLITTATYFLAEIKFQGRGITGTLAFVTDVHKVGRPLDERIHVIFQKITELFSLSFIALPQIVVIGIIIVLIGLLFFHQKKVQRKPVLFLLIWVCNILLFLLFNTGISGSSFVFAPTLLAFIILISYLIVVMLPRIVMLVLVVLVLVGQILTTTTWLSQNITPLSVQLGTSLPNAKKVVDYTYKAAGNKPFLLTTITSPLYTNTTWAYLYDYQKDSRPFLPYWYGNDQTGMLGSDVLPLRTKDTNISLSFLIIEPHEGIPEYFIKQIVDDANSHSVVVETKHIGTYVIEKRIMKSAKK